MQAHLSGKVALVVGSSKGIGKAIAIKFADNGADVVINARTAGPALKVVDQVRALGQRSIFEQADVSQYQQAKQMVSNAVEKLGKVDILVVAGAGVGATKLDFFREISPEQYIDWVQIIWFNKLNCIRAVLDHMIERRSGKIINIGTDAGRWPTPGESMIGGAGAGLVMMTKVMASELARWQIRINTICASLIKDTPGYEVALGHDTPVAHVFRKALERQPFPVTSKDIAEAALFFASDDSNAITGQILSVNGGLSFPG